MICEKHLPYLIKHPRNTECPLCIPKVQFALYEHQKELFENQQRQFDLQLCIDRQWFEHKIAVDKLNDLVAKVAAKD